MRITEEQVRYVATLARLTLSDAEVAKFQHDLDGILEHFAAIDKIDTSDIEPMRQVLFAGGDTATLRPGEPVAPLGNELALANAPQPGAGYFKVPKVIER